jgi:hypothetical protein
MGIRSRLLRMSTAVFLVFVTGSMLMLEPVAGVSAEGGGDTSKMPPALRARVSGLLDLALNSDDAGGGAPNTRLSNFRAGSDECNVKRGGSIKVNQNCLNVSDADLQGRAQAQNETAIAVDPNDSRHIVTSYNDYRRGDGTCGTSYSQDGGRTWNDSTAPNGFTRGFGGFAREYWQAGGDTSVAWDSQGNAYLSCQLFNRGQPTSPNPDLSSTFVVFRSTQNGGASWDFPGRYVTLNQDTAGAGAILEDKQYLTVDNSVTSPFRDRLYVTWTEFTPTTAYIYEAFSADYGETFSAKHQVSPGGTQPLCPAPFLPNQGCDNNQSSQPFTAPDGTLYVVWANYNAVPGLGMGDDDNGGAGVAGGAAAAAPTVGVENRQQVLLSRSTDGGNTFSAPTRVGDFYELPDCLTYQGGQDPGRSCVPEKGASMKSVFRAANYPSGAVNPRSPSQVVVAYGSYISRTSNEANGCVPQGFNPNTALPLYDGVKTAGACNNKIVVSLSTDAGASFTGTTQNVRTLPTANPTKEQRRTDQWFHWLAFSGRGTLAVSYYDRAYGDDETTANSDISLSSTSDPTGLRFNVKRVTSNSMPSPTEFPNGLGNSQFWGDYAGLAINGDTAMPIWSDTRDPDIFTCPGSATPGHPPKLCGATEANGLAANDQDIFTDLVNLFGRGGTP